MMVMLLLDPMCVFVEGDVTRIVFFWCLHHAEFLFEKQIIGGSCCSF